MMPEVTDPAILMKLNNGPKGMPAPILTVPNTRGAAADARDELRTKTGVADTVHDNTNSDEQLDIATKGQAFTQQQGLQDNYNQNQAVKAYEASWPMYMASLRTKADRTGDLLLVTAYAKLTDPTTGVLGGEREGVAQGSQSWVENKQAELRSLMDQEGGNFSTDTRMKLRAELTNLLRQRNQAYNQQRLRYKADAEAFGIKPEQVIGPHVGASDQDFVNDFWKKKDGAAAPAGQGDVDPELKSRFPDAVSFNYDDDGVLTGYTDKDGVEAIIVTIDRKTGQLLDPEADRKSRDKSIAEQSQALDKIYGEPSYGDRFKSGNLFSLDDEIAGIGGAIGETLQGGSPVDGYTNARDVMRARQGRADENTGFLGDAAEFVGNVANPLPYLTGGPVAGATLAGGLTGFGEGDGAAESLVGAAVGAGTGAVIGKGVDLAAPYIAKGINAVRSKVPTSVLPTVDANAIAQAGAAENVAVPRVMVAPELANKTTVAESTLSGGPVIRGGMQDVSKGIEEGVSRLSPGSAIDRDIAGTVMQGAAKRADRSMKSVTDRLYDKFRSASGNPAVTPTKALEQVDSELAELAKAPQTNAGEIKYLQDVRSDLARGDMTIDTLLGLRRSIRGQISERNLGLSQAEARAQRVLNAAGDDIQATLKPGSPAAQLLKKANESHAERQVFKRQIVKDLLGNDRDIPLDPDKAFAKLEQWAKPGADGNRLIAAWKKLEPEEAADLAATIAVGLGRDKGDVFSPALFVSQVERLSPRARATIFGPEGKKSIDNLVTLSNAHKRVMGTLNNSRSGVSLNSMAPNAAQALVTAASAGGGLAAGGSLTGAITGGTVAGLLLGKGFLDARMLMSPNIAKWTTGLLKKPNTAAVLDHIKRLTAVANAEPAIANDILGLQGRLMSAFNDAPQQLAAKANGPSEHSKSEQNTTTAGAPR